MVDYSNNKSHLSLLSQTYLTSSFDTGVMVLAKHLFLRHSRDELLGVRCMVRWRRATRLCGHLGMALRVKRLRAS